MCIEWEAKFSDHPCALVQCKVPARTHPVGVSPSQPLQFCLLIQQVESDEDSQASQDSMIIHDTTPPEPEVDPNRRQNTVPESVANSTEFQADWVPPWRIKAGRVPSRSRASVSTEPVRSSAEEDAQITHPRVNQSVPENTHSSNTKPEVNSFPPEVITLDVKNTELPADIGKETIFPEPEAPSDNKLLWTKRFGSKDDLLKPHAPIPWRGHSDTEDNGWRSVGIKNSDKLKLVTDGSKSDSENWRPSSSVNNSSVEYSSLNDGQRSVGISERSDGVKSTGLAGRESPDSVSSMTSADEKLEAEIMDRLEREALEEEQETERKLGLTTNEVVSNLVNSEKNLSKQKPRKKEDLEMSHRLCWDHCMCTPDVLAWFVDIERVRMTPAA